MFSSCTTTINIGSDSNLPLRWAMALCFPSPWPSTSAPVPMVPTVAALPGSCPLRSWHLSGNVGLRRLTRKQPRVGTGATVPKDRINTTPAMAMAYSGLHLAWCPRVAASCRPSGATRQWRGRDRVVLLPQLTPLCQLSCVESNNAKVS